MNVKEMKLLLDTVANLNCTEANLMMYDSRSGDTSLSRAKLEARELEDGTVVVIARYE